MTTPSDPPAYVPVVQYQTAAAGRMQTAAAATPAPRRRRWGPMLAAAAALVVLAGGGYLGWTVLAGDTFTIRGTVLLADDDIALGPTSCSGRGGYADMRDGTQVTVTDPAGTVVALGELKAGQRGNDTSGNRCVFPFEVSGVPAGHGFYGIEVSQRGRMQYPEAQVRTAPVALTLGS